MIKYLNYSIALLLGCQVLVIRPPWFSQNPKLRLLYTDDAEWTDCFPSFQDKSVLSACSVYRKRLLSSDNEKAISDPSRSEDHPAGGTAKQVKLLYFEAFTRRHP